MTFVLLFVLATTASSPPELRVRFIGNAAFEISDGSTSILTDFPYQSGAFGYMKYRDSEIRTRSGAVCLFSHRHADHFAPSLIDKIGCSVIGPSEVLSRVPESQQLRGAPLWHFGSATIRCISTEHGSVEHCSYVIDWHDLRIVFAGDVEHLELLKDLASVDVLFSPVWLADKAQAARASWPGLKIILCHRKPDEMLPKCQDCLFPNQGGSFVIN